MATGGTYLTIDGFAGSSSNPDFPNAIEVLSYSLEKATRVDKSANHESQKPAFSELHIVKALDATSAAFAQAVSTGQPFKSAVLTSVSAGRVDDDDDDDNGPRTFRLTMTDVFVVSSQLSGGESPLESVTLSVSGIVGPVPPAHQTVQSSHRHLMYHMQFRSQQGQRSP